MKKNILILGANGMAGHILTLYFRQPNQKYNVIAVARKDSIIEPDYLLDVSNFKLLAELINTFKPDYIINAIGILNTKAENQPDQAILINSYLPHFLESQTTKTSIKIIHISTDCVFSGRKGGYKENDLKDGNGYYAQSKALGELWNHKDVTLRTSIIGPEIENGIGLFHWFMNQNGVINGFTKAIWSGITTLELAKVIDEIINQNITGLYHISNNIKINKYELLKIFKKITGKEIKIEATEGINLDKSIINSRTEFIYQIPDYEKMVKEMINFIIINKKIYPNYSFGKIAR